MYTILIINFVIGVLTIILSKCVAHIAAQNLKQEFPNITFRKPSTIVKISAQIRVFIFAFTPIVNIIALLGICTDWENMIDVAEEKLWERVENF